MKIFVLLNFVLLGCLGFSQNQGKQNEIKINPIRIVGLFRSSIEMSYERKTSDYFSSQIGLGYILPQNIYGNSIEKNKKGFSLELEEKYYFDGDIVYFAVSIFYLQENYNLTRLFIDEDLPYLFANTYLDEFNLNKQIIKPSFKFGAKFITKSNILFDFNIGLGAKYKNTKHSNRDNVNDELYIRREDYSIKLYKNSEFWSPNIIFNVKMGYQF